MSERGGFDVNDSGGVIGVVIEVIGFIHNRRTPPTYSSTTSWSASAGELVDVAAVAARLDLDRLGGPVHGAAL